jgi:hypothetical protein
MERLENGTTFDGVDIINILETGAMNLVKEDIFMQTSISRFGLFAIPKNTDTDITFVHLIDGATTGIDYTLSQAEATKKYVNVLADVFSVPGIFHSFYLSATTNNETKGIEPLVMTVYFKQERNKLQ